MNILSHSLSPYSMTFLFDVSVNVSEFDCSLFEKCVPVFFYSLETLAYFVNYIKNFIINSMSIGFH